MIRPLSLLIAASPGGWLTAAPPTPATAGRRLDFQIGDGFKSLNEHFRDWLVATPKVHHGFIHQLSSALGVV